MRTLISNKCAQTVMLSSRQRDKSGLPIVTHSLTTKHKPDQLLELVSDIRRYPEFINFIKAMRVSGERSEGHIFHKLGEARVAFRGFSEGFATAVMTDPMAKTVDVNLVRGPFRRLKNTWSFKRLGDAQTQVDFYIDYSFSNPILSMLARTNSDKVISMIIDAFMAEADRRYTRTPQL